MAEMIKSQFDLPTLHARLEFGPAEGSAGSGPSVVTQIYHGEVPVGPEERAPFDPGHSSNLASLVSGRDLFGSSKDRTLWLHIDQDSTALAQLEWEQFLPLFKADALVRIPNFLDNTYVPVDDPLIVICASAPIADGPYALAAYVRDLLDMFRECTAGLSPRFHIFADREAFPELSQLASGPGDGASVIVHKPPNEVPEIPGRLVHSAWLRWIITSLEGDAADILHFISPGYKSSERGAIVLASRPDENSIQGDMIGAPELAAFFDRIGCSVMAFSSPDMPQWVNGQRLLVEELSWLRPGPICLAEDPAKQQAALRNFYSLLFPQVQSRPVKLSASPALRICCHPEILGYPPVGPRLYAEPGRFDITARAANFLRGRSASLSKTRPLSSIEYLEDQGVRGALDFLSEVAMSGGEKQ